MLSGSYIGLNSDSPRKEVIIKHGAGAALPGIVCVTLDRSP